jgi:hypothetical protein
MSKWHRSRAEGIYNISKPILENFQTKRQTGRETSRTGDSLFGFLYKSETDVVKVGDEHAGQFCRGEMVI